MFGEVYKGKRILLTGHTGFKGAWLCEWLLMLGADVYGYAFAPSSTMSLYNDLGLSERIDDFRGDVRDQKAISKRVGQVQPDFVFHLAAQALVRQSYSDPVDTFSTNVMGTVNLLDALRHIQKKCAVVVVTTDKVYENNEWDYGYRENDPLGGHDPYSASKACVELISTSWCKSFLAQSECISMATARAGNVIGGGDWAEDRIVPDCIRALQRDQSIIIRNPCTIRPWQHVLESLSGYLLLAIFLLQGKVDATSFNFGPYPASSKSVQALVEEVLKNWPGEYVCEPISSSALYEARRLTLGINKAYHVLGWSPVWSFEETIRRTIEGYREGNIITQIAEYCADAERMGLAWAK